MTDRTMDCGSVIPGFVSVKDLRRLASDIDDQARTTPSRREAAGLRDAADQIDLLANSATATECRSVDGKGGGGMTYEQVDRAWSAICDALEEYLDASKSDDPFARPDSWVVGKARDAFIKALTEEKSVDRGGDDV